MATIQSQLTVRDGMSPILRRINQNLQTLTGSFIQMQQVSANPIATQNMQAAVSGLNQIFDELGMVTAEINGATTAQYGFNDAVAAGTSSIRNMRNAQNGFNASVQAGNSLPDSMLSKVKGGVATLAAASGVGALFDTSDRMAGATARLSLIVDDQNSVESLQKKIFASAQASRGAYLDTMDTVGKLGLTASDAFTGNDEMIRFAQLMNQNFIIAGASATEQSSAMYQLTQAMASGRLQGDEYRSIIENAPLLANSIEDYMRNVQGATGTMKDWAAEGLLTSDVIKAALFSSADEIETRFAQIPMTWGQVWTMMGNIAIQVLAPVLSAINWLANNISIIGPIVLALAGAFAVFQIAAHWTQIATTAADIYHGVVNFLSIGFGILTGNTAAASAAVFTFNSALLTNPIVWVVMLIMVLIGALYAGVAAYNKFTGSAVSATGIIGAAFAVLGAHIINTFVVPAWNGLAMFANFVGNVFNNPIAAVKVLFYDMCLTVIGYILNLANAIENLLNKIPGVTVDITSGLDSFYAGLEQAQQAVKDESGWVEYAQKMDYIDYNTAASAGYDFGSGIADKVSNFFNPSIDDYNEDMSGYQPALDGINGNTGSTAASLKNMSEDVAYMRDIAEREAINRFTTAELHIDMTGMNNRFENDMDVDGVIDRFVTGVTEALDVAGEGVHP